MTLHTAVAQAEVMFLDAMKIT